ncbi:MAG: hypothetical protein CSA70_11015 [Rhodobacterales bacterium]|nr:MAG: hypothetical protein CSA70_11015 [Rhodobacterales bacterium]
MTPASAPPQVALASAMRNEGPFLLEWLAYHKVIGFGPILIATNDCTDGSDRLLDLLETAGELIHIHSELNDGESPQDVAMRRFYATLDSTPIDWLCFIDSDEFVHITHGAGRIDDLMQVVGKCDVIGLPWLPFGDSGHQARKLPILPNFTRCAISPAPELCKFKSIFRFRNFEHAEDHRPVRPRIENPLVKSAEGKKLRSNFRADRKYSRYKPYDKSIAHHAACINHYGTRAADDFLMKNDRGDGHGVPSGKYYLGSLWHRTCNQNEGEDRRILRHWPAVETELARLRALPGVAATERDCLEWDEARRAEVLTEENRMTWRKVP